VEVPYLSPISLLQTFPHKMFRGKVDSQIRLFDEFSVGCCRWIDTTLWLCFCSQEDMDSMQKELDVWRRENKEHEIALRREER